MYIPTYQVVQGAAFSQSGIQGYAPDGSVPTFFGTGDTLSGAVFLGPNAMAVLGFTPTWTDFATCQFSATLTAAQTSQLTIDTTYILQCSALHSGTLYTPVFVYLQVLAAPGFAPVAPAFPDLITPAYASQLLGSFGITPAQLEQVPALITASSAAWRKWCNRIFTQTMIVEDLLVELDGYARLSQIPAYTVNRVQINPAVALTVTNGSAASAWVSSTVSGVIASGLTLTGLVLNWQVGGTLSTQTIQVIPGQTIADVAGLINAVGSGWSATADRELGAWNSTEIFDAIGSRGASESDQPEGAATFRVYASNCTNAYFYADEGQQTGMLFVGRQRSAGLDFAWGPTYGDSISQSNPKGRCRVTYLGGFPTVPYEVQLGTLELVKACLERLKNELILDSERAKDYQYKLALEMIEAIPKNIRQMMALYKVSNA